MADIKWIKLATNMHDDEKIKLIDAMPGRDTIHYVWIRILLLGGKINANGEIFLSEGKPLTAKMLAILFSRSLASINLALKVLSRLGMIEIAPNKIIRIVNWDKHQNIEGMERVREQNRKRAENHREKKKEEKKAAKSNDIDENIILDESKELEIIETNEDGSLENHETLNENEVIENLENSEEMSVNSTDNNKTNVVTTVESHNNIAEDINNYSNVTKNIGNVTQNKSNVTVTEQNKKQIENKKKNKKEKKEIDKDKNMEGYKNNACDLNNKSSTGDEEVSKSSLFEDNNTKSEYSEEENINLKALELMHYHEKITGKPGGCDYVALSSAINLHGEKRVKMAMDIGFENNCQDIKYAIGVLKNWRRQGYPKDDMEVKTNGVRSTRKSDAADKNEFAGFKPKEPRKLTEAERKKAEATLI